MRYGRNLRKQEKKLEKEKGGKQSETERGVWNSKNCQDFIRSFQKQSFLVLCT